VWLNWQRAAYMCVCVCVYANWVLGLAEVKVLEAKLEEVMKRNGEKK